MLANMLVDWYVIGMPARVLAVLVMLMPEVVRGPQYSY